MPVSSWMTDKERVFQDCMKAMDAGQEVEPILQRYPGLAGELRPELEAAAWLKKKQAAVSTRPGYVAASRRRLEARLQLEGGPRPHPVVAWLARLAHWPWNVRQVGQTLALVVLLVVFVSVTRDAFFASRNALPGDALYPLKLAKEGALLAATSDPVERARLQVSYSQLRAFEIEGLILEGRYDRLSQAAVKYVLQVEQTRQVIDSLSASHPNEAAVLASQLHKTFASQSVALPVLINMLPIEARSSVQPVMMVAR